LILKKEWLEEVHQSAINLELDCAKFFEPDFLLRYQVLEATSSNPQNRYFDQSAVEPNNLEELFRSDAQILAMQINTPVSNSRSQRRASSLRPEVPRLPTNNEARPLRQSTAEVLRQDSVNPLDISGTLQSPFNPIVTSSRNDKQTGKRTAKHVLGRRRTRKGMKDSSSADYVGVSLKIQVSRKRPTLLKKNPSSYPSSETSSTKKKKSDKRKVSIFGPDLFEDLQQTPVTNLDDQAFFWNDNVERATQIETENAPTQREQDLSFYAGDSEDNQEYDIFMDDEERELLSQFNKR
jgi:hypothetical protein